MSCYSANPASIVIDVESGRVLHESNADGLNYPASLTKMMTLYMVFSALRNNEITLDTRWQVSKYAASRPPTKLGLRAGRTISVRDCILALVTRSANDMAVVVAEGLAGSESRFARRMTEKSRDLQMKYSTFKNASGLPDRGQTTTARDISVLALALIRDFPEYYGFFSTRLFQYGKSYHRNHNHLLYSYRGTDGIKTGYIRASGYNLAASTVRNGRRLIGVVIGGRTAPARDRLMVALLDRAFTQLEREGPRQVNNSFPNGPATSLQAEARFASRADLEESVPHHRIPSRPIRTPRRWGVQVGAFSYFKPARSAALHAKHSAPGILDETELVISPFRSPTGFLYRARLIGIAEEEAREACEVLQSKQISCIPVAPRMQQAALSVH
ncbi:MAG: D-alanyl-D-alanine carboxypeptidase family protein [Gammaproteobacteria bacterium]